MRYDVIVVGAGPGGYVAAIRAAQLGRKVALVERAEVGGVCLNWGCIPTKALLKSATVYQHCKNAVQYGVGIEGVVTPDLKAMVARSRTVAETMSKGIRFLLKKNNIDLIEGFGRLVAPHLLDVEGTTYEADHIILATGAQPRRLESIPVDGERIITSKEALLLEKLPATMIVVGTGAIGSELAWFYAALGVKVTLVEYLPRMMPLEDEEVSKAMERAFRKLRATVLTGTTVKAARVVEEHCEVEIEGKKGAEVLQADVVLSAVGIEPNTQHIGLEELGVAMERGRVVVDAYYRTKIEGLYAICDIVKVPALEHVASAEAICFV
ncbi:MAG: FAD-dependent oxidoreductase, partial [Alistipes sp.]|nr:FAD-dependent oxidoreductase [Alistipes sp.]